MTGSQNVGKGWRSFFWVASAFNLVVGFAGMAQAEGDTQAMIVALLVACFGVVYALVARDPLRFAPVLIAGIIGKLGVVALLGPANWQAGGDPVIGAVVAGDLLFALGFAWFLLAMRKA